MRPVLICWRLLIGSARTKPYAVVTKVGATVAAELDYAAGSRGRCRLRCSSAFDSSGDACSVPHAALSRDYIAHDPHSVHVHSRARLNYR
jgi:hypothetical protein